jgi:NAD(P)-dependent dehydrogenase (short-subunit alcohol dehydrogenase family)
MAQGEVRFDGRAILVTGGGRGLGRAQALLLAARGASVVVADNGAAMDGEDASAGPAQTVAAEIRAAGGQAVACVADLATEAGSAQAVAAALDAFGRIDGLLHAASTSPNNTGAASVSSHDLDLVMRINPFAAFWMTRAAWPHLVGQGYGRIVYMTSGGVYGAEGSAPYSAAKAAYIGMMRSLAVEGARHGVWVNLVAPAAYTRMTERMPASDYADWFERTMTPEKTAPAVAWLLSEDCGIHGEMFAVGGGRVSRLLLAESAGVMGCDASIEAVGAAMPAVMADQRLFYPKDLGERSLEVAKLFGYGGRVEADAYDVRPIDKS